MNLTEATLTTIIYEKDSGDTSSRVVIPVSVPKTNVRAIDVSELEPADREKLRDLYTEYRQYTEAFVAGMFNFETWVEHTKGETIAPKWRQFKLTGLR